MQGTKQEKTVEENTERFYVARLNMSGEIQDGQVAIYAHADQVVSLDDFQNDLESMLTWVQRVKGSKK